MRPIVVLWALPLVLHASWLFGGEGLPDSPFIFRLAKWPFLHPDCAKSYIQNLRFDAQKKCQKDNCTVRLPYSCMYIDPCRRPSTVIRIAAEGATLLFFLILLSSWVRWGSTRQPELFSAPTMLAEGGELNLSLPIPPPALRGPNWGLFLYQRVTH